MQSNLKYFIAVAQELNISKAAKKLYISQQCLSNHIKRLEAHYNTQFFIRKPRLVLTSQGKILFEALQQIQHIEDVLSRELNDDNNNCVGNISIGISGSRSRLLIPDIISEFSKSFPMVKVRVIQGSSDLEGKLLTSNLDLFVSASRIQSPYIQSSTLLKEKIYLAASSNILKSHFDDFPHCLARFENGVDFAEFCDIPLATTNTTNRLRQIVDEFMQENNYSIKIFFEGDGVDIHLSLCQKDCCIFFCPQMYASHIQQLQRSESSDNPLYFFAVNGLTHTMEHRLCQLKSTYVPVYQKKFVQILSKAFSQYQ